MEEQAPSSSSPGTDVRCCLHSQSNAGHRNSPTREFLQFSPFSTAGLQYIAGWRQHNCAVWSGGVLC